MKRSSHCKWSLQGLEEMVYVKSGEHKVHRMFLSPLPASVMGRSGCNNYSRTKLQQKASKERFLHCSVLDFSPRQICQPVGQAERHGQATFWFITDTGMTRVSGMHYPRAQLNLRMQFSLLILNSNSFHQNLSVFSATQMPVVNLNSPHVVHQVLCTLFPSIAVTALPYRGVSLPNKLGWILCWTSFAENCNSIEHASTSTLFMVLFNCWCKDSKSW